MRFATLLLILPAFAQLRLDSPRFGMIRDQNHALRTLFGVEGNPLAGEKLMDGVVSTGFGGRMGWVKTDRALLVVDESGRIAEEYPAPPGPAVFGFAASGEPVLAYLPETAKLLKRKDLSLDSIEVPCEAEIRALASSGETGILFVAGPVLYKLSGSSCTPLRTLGTAAGPVLVTPDGTVIEAAASELIISHPDLTEQRLLLPSPVESIEWLGLERLAVRSNRLFSVRLGKHPLRLTELPEAPQ